MHAPNENWTKLYLPNHACLKLSLATHAPARSAGEHPVRVQRPSQNTRHQCGLRSIPEAWRRGQPPPAQLAGVPQDGGRCLSTQSVDFQ